MTATATIDRSACPAARHGRYWAYNHHRCRCPDAITEWRARRRAAYHGTLPPGYVDATGTRRRLQALAVEGWSIVRLAELTGLSERSLFSALYDRDRVQVGTARAVAAVYQRIAGQGGAPGGANIAGRARRRGWHDCYAWPDHTIDDPAATPQLVDPLHVDQVAVDRALDGDPAIRLTPAEKAAAVRLGLARGVNPHALARLLHISVQTISRLTQPASTKDAA